MRGRISKPMDEWSTDDIPDLTGKTAVVTGASSGLGQEIALQLAKKGCHVVMACRHPAKAEFAKSQILEKFPAAKLSIEQIDMASIASVESFAKTITQKYPAISLLVNNAGVVDLPYAKSKDGFELVFQTNYLSHFLLTSHLYPLLRDSDDARIVFIGSTHHSEGKINFDDLQDEKNHTARSPYFNSKLMLLNFCMELNRRIRDDGHHVMSVAAHPGFAATNILTSTEGKKTGCFRNAFFSFLKNHVAQPVETGALSILYAATSPDAYGGEYYGPDGFQEYWGKIHITHGIHTVYDEEIARKLWDASEQLLNRKFDLHADAPRVKPEENLEASTDTPARLSI